MNLATRLLKGYSMSYSEIALITDLSLVEIEKLAKEIREKEVTS